MPTQPPLEGLPLWAQLAISFAVCLATLIVAVKGYFIKEKPSVVAADPQSAAIMAASIADMGAIRNLSECVIRLDTSVQSLEKAIVDAAHHERNNIDVCRELCARLRELREIMERRSE